MDNNFYTPEELAFLENNPQQQQQLPEPPEQASQVHCSPSMITSTPEEQMLAAQSKLEQLHTPVSIAREAISIFTGLVFIIIPVVLCTVMLTTMSLEMPVILAPIIFWSVFFITGLTSTIKSIVRLVKMLKEK